jgi:hypothetical protein
MSKKEFQAYLAERDALFRNPNAADAAKWWARYITKATPVDSSVPLAGVHKARLQWLDATDAMIAESKAWLEANAYQLDWKGAPPLTPEQRDADRISLGKEPLNKREADDDFSPEGK